MKKIDKFLNDITMYKLVLYGLLTLSGISIILGFFGKLNWSGLSIVYSLLLIVATCYIVNLIFSKLFKVSANSESYFITALILFFLIKPFSNLKEAEFIALAGAIAMASKYLIAYKHKHIFNPAAFGAFAIVLGSAFTLTGLATGAAFLGAATFLAFATGAAFLGAAFFASFFTYFFFAMALL
jgi:Na+-transporting NADH:ubiquinone oxidoreductase subunit NqrB